MYECSSATSYVHSLKQSFLELMYKILSPATILTRILERLSNDRFEVIVFRRQ